jgi:predicted methyltransferase
MNLGIHSLEEVEGLAKRNTRLITGHYEAESSVTLFHGDRLQLLEEIPDEAAKLIVTSPPYNIGKKYEKRLAFNDYLKLQRDTLKESVRILSPEGSLCWQVGESYWERWRGIPVGHVCLQNLQATRAETSEPYHLVF